MVNFRGYTLASGRKIFAGRDAESNDRLVSSAKRDDLILHTEARGSPFVNLGENPNEDEVAEAAIFCAKYSHDWRDNKKDVVVGKFVRGDMKKGEFMKVGSWNVKKSEKIKVKKADILKLEERFVGDDFK